MSPPSSSLSALRTGPANYGHELSGGMQQRVGLARAFATEAPILLMDEPFSALDPLIRTKLQDELMELQEKLQKTIVFVSHDLEEALKIGNRISIMEGAASCMTGTPEEIVLSPANDYVREFISNVNPMSVLTAWNIMRDARDLETAGEGWLWARPPPHDALQVRQEHAGGRCRKGRGPGHLGPPARTSSACRRTGHRSSGPRPATPLKTVIRAMHQSHTAPVAIFDDQSRFQGAIGVQDVLKAVVRR